MFCLMVDPDQLLLSVSQVVPELRPIRRKQNYLEMNLSPQNSEPVMVRTKMLQSSNM